MFTCHLPKNFIFSGIEELENKNSDLESKLSAYDSKNTELISSNKLLHEKLLDAEGRKRITAQRLGQDLNKERQHSRSMGMQVDILSKENAELTKTSTKVSSVIYNTGCVCCNVLLLIATS